MMAAAAAFDASEGLWRWPTGTLPVLLNKEAALMEVAAGVTAGPQPFHEAVAYAAAPVWFLRALANDRPRTVD